jgi:hypothetical protein
MKARTKRAPKVCVICGRPRFIERNHPGGQNHISWFTMLFCKEHHDYFHELLRIVGVDLRYTPNELERLNRASQAIIVCQCMIAEAMKKAISKNPHQG